MSKLLHTLAQVGLVLLQVANASVAVIPPPYNIAVSATLAGVQAVLAVLNHKAPAPAAPVAK